MKVEAILFDMIGTTVLEKKANTIRDCFRAAFKNYGIFPDNQVIKANRGKDKIVMIENILQEGNYLSNLAVPIFQAFQRNVDNRLDNFVAAKNVEGLFTKYRQDGIKIGLGTGLPKEQAVKIMNHLGWKEEDFDYMGFSSVLGAARPNPIMILDMMKLLGLQNKETFVKIGDTLADIEEGQNAGVKTGVVLSGTQSKSILIQSKPDFIFNVITELNFIIP